MVLFGLRHTIRSPLRIVCRTGFRVSSLMLLGRTSDPAERDYEPSGLVRPVLLKKPFPPFWCLSQFSRFLASVMDIFNKPFHPYSRGLLKSIPRIGARAARLHEIEGTVPILTKVVTGCKFADRCSHVFSICRKERPHLVSVGDHHKARCWLKEYPERRKADA